MLSKEEALVADNVRKLMDDQELSLRELADKSGVNFATIHSFVKEGHSPRFGNVCALAGALGVSVADLLSGSVRKLRSKVSA